MLGCCVAERRELPNGGVRRQTHGVLVEPGHRFEQWTIEQPRMKSADARRVAFDLGLEDAERIVPSVRPHVRRAREPTQALAVVRRGEGVCALESLQLQAVFEQAEELVRRAKVRGIVAPDVSAVGERGQGLHRIGHAQRFVGTPMHHLQQLHRKFNVAQAAFSEFEFAFPQILGDEFFDPPTHRLHLRHKGFALRGRPHQRTQASM